MGAGVWSVRLRQRDLVAVGVDLVGFDEEVGEVGDAEAGGDGDVGGVAAGGHEDAADARDVVAGVHGPPAVIEEDLVPGGEVAGAGVGDADVAEVAGDVAGGDVHGAAEGDGEVLEVAADADAFGEDVEGGLGGAGGHVVEGDVVVDPVADVDGARPAGGGGAEEVVGDGAHLVDLAVAAGEQELEGVGGQIADGCLDGLGTDLVGVAGVLDDVGSGETQGAGGGDEAEAAVAEGVEEAAGRDGGDGLRLKVLDADLIGLDDDGVEGWMELEERDHRRGDGRWNWMLNSDRRRMGHR